MKFILGTKLSMTQVFREDGTVVPVTRVQAGPCVVTAVREVNGKKSLQVGMGNQKSHRLSKALRGHLQGITPTPKVVREVVLDGDTTLKRGDVYSVKTFAAGEKVEVAGRGKGRGFQGVVKRHNFKGSPASHGHKDQLRMPGSIGATDAARVFKGTRMGGHMGDQSVTVKNLEIIEVHEDTNELYIKGAIPGARGGVLIITAPEGDIVADVAEEPTPEAAPETPAPEEKKEEAVAEEPAKEEQVEEKKEDAPAAKEETSEEAK